MSKVYALVIFLVAACACSAPGVKRKVISLDEAITDYNNSLRWSMLEKIDAYHLSRNGEKKSLDRAAMERVRVTGYTILEQTVNTDVTEAVVKGEIAYYTTDSGTLKKFPFTNVWWYSDEERRWYNGSDYPQFK
jgi:hypothetical protein